MQSSPAVELQPVSRPTPIFDPPRRGDAPGPLKKMTVGAEDY